MAFVLRDSEGKEWSFDDQARLGRTADNDVVVKDAAASRSHARVFEKKGRHFVEDLGSANGTRVNGASLKAPKEVKPGDVIAIGDVEYEFGLGDDGAADEPEQDSPQSTFDDSSRDDEPEDDDDGGDPSATNDDSDKPARPARGGGRALSKRPAPAPVRRARPPADEEPDDEPEPDDPPPDDAPDEEEPPQEEPESVNPRSLVKGGATGLRAALRSKESQAALSAAERARERRELGRSGAGRLSLWFRDLHIVGKIGVVVGLLVMIGAVGWSIQYVIPKPPPPKPEPLTLVPNSDPLAESFGAGEDVTYQRIDQKQFTFQPSSAIRTVGVLHYQSKGISKDEVKVTLNATDIESVPPDALDSDARINEMVLPAALIKLREDNTIIFDNTRNPPGKEEWKIWGVFVEAIPVPEVSPEEAARQARVTIDNALKNYELKNVGADNLFKAWKLYREAWLLLESTPDRPEDILQIARTRMNDIRPELDGKCNLMSISVQTEINHNNYKRVRAALADIIRHFPTREHSCHTWAKAQQAEYDGIEFVPAQ